MTVETQFAEGLSVINTLKAGSPNDLLINSGRSFMGSLVFDLSLSGEALVTIAIFRVPPTSKRLFYFRHRAAATGVSGLNVRLALYSTQSTIPVIGPVQFFKNMNRTNEEIQSLQTYANSEPLSIPPDSVLLCEHRLNSTFQSAESLEFILGRQRTYFIVLLNDGVTGSGRVSVILYLSERDSIKTRYIIK